MGFNFDELFAILKQNLYELAKTTCKDHVDQAVADGLSVLNQLRGNLQVWTQKLAQKEEGLDDFKFFLEGQKESLKMFALKQAGLTLIEVDQFKSALLGNITATLQKVI